jgi:hypothetical protein
MADEFEQLIEQLTAQSNGADSELVRLQAKLLVKMAEAQQQTRRQLVNAIAQNLKTQRMIRQVIGRPRN